MVCISLQLVKLLFTLGELLSNAVKHEGEAAFIQTIDKSSFPGSTQT